MPEIGFRQTPRAVPRVETRYRRIVTALPVPESLPLLERLRRCEPRSMGGQPPIVWDRAEGFQVRDAWGNRWLDLSSGVLIANCGHGHPRVRAAIEAQAARPLLTSYCFANEPRARLVELLSGLAPAGLDKVFLLTTGSEAVENAIKLAMTRGARVGGPGKRVVVSFEVGFHGRTLGSQLAGGSPALKAWIGPLDPRFVQVPFPDGYYGEDTRLEGFTAALAAHGVDPRNVCAVVMETYQGATAAFAPTAYMKGLRDWCSDNEALLVLDEIQAGFGRTGRMWGFEHLGVVPDLICCGKGISSSLPLSAVIGRPDVMDLYGPGEMTSTHSGNPVCAAAAVASIEVIRDERLVENAARVGEVLLDGLRGICRGRPYVGALFGKGLVAAVMIVRPGTKEPDKALATRIVERCYEKGLLLFAPVGKGGGALKICPPLCITEDAAREAVETLREAMDEVAGA